MSASLGSPISRISVAGDEQNPLVTADASMALPVEAGKTPLTENNAPKHVLLVEDDAPFREIIKVFLCGKGYVVHEAANGLDGIVEAMAADFSIILCDVQLPALPGDLFYGCVERNRPELCERIIFMTGYPADSVANNFIRSINARLLIKPFPLEELGTVMEAIEKQALSQESKANPASPPLAAAAVEPPPVQISTAVAKPEEKRVLLLEDDAAFRNVMKEFLSEAGFTVREAQNGVQGIREIMESEFAIILCDMMMPGMAGDHFFHGVKRVRPHLAERFIFMTGHRGDTKINAFIRKTTCRALVKPFALDQLLEAIDGVGKPSPTPPDEAWEPEESVTASPLSAASPAPSSTSSTSGRLVDRPRQAVAPSTPVNSTRPAISVEPCAPSSSPVVVTYRSRRILGRLILPASVAVAGVVLILWQSVLGSRCAALAAELAAAQREQIAASKELAEAQLLEPGIRAAVSTPDQLKKERAVPKWTPVLRRVGQAFGGGLEIQGFRAREISGAAGACELHIDGLSIGLNRRAIADAFRRKIGQELQQDSGNAPVKTGFLRLEELFAPPGTGEDRQPLDFEVAATVRVEDAPVFKQFLAD